MAKIAARNGYLRLAVAWLTGVTAWLGAALPLPAEAAQAPESESSSYEVHYGALLVGRLTRTREAGDDRYVLRSVLEPAGAARWLGGDRLVETSEGARAGIEPRPRRYRFVDERKGRNYLFRFDWSAGQVRNDHPEHPDGAFDIVPQLQDEVSVLWLLRLSLEQGAARLEVPVVSGSKGRIYRHQYEITGRQTVSVPAGTFETVQVARRTSRGKYRMQYWCAPELGYLPVRVSRIDRDGREVTMQLESHRPPARASHRERGAGRRQRVPPAAASPVA